MSLIFSKTGLPQREPFLAASEVAYLQFQNDRRGSVVQMLQDYLPNIASDDLFQMAHIAPAICARSAQEDISDVGAASCIVVPFLNHHPEIANDLPAQLQNYISLRLLGDHTAAAQEKSGDFHTPHQDFPDSADPYPEIPVEEQVLQQAHAIAEFDLFSAVNRQSVRPDDEVFWLTLDLKIEISKRREDYPTSLATPLRERRQATEEKLGLGRSGPEPRF